MLTELREIQSKVLDLREQLAASKGELSHVVARAIERHRLGSKIHTIGGVVRGGETLLEIVPDHDQLVVEVRLRPQDVDDVQVTQPTEVRLTAFNQRTTPTLQGRVPSSRPTLSSSSARLSLIISRASRSAPRSFATSARTAATRHACGGADKDRPTDNDGLSAPPVERQLQSRLAGALKRGLGLRAAG